MKQSDKARAATRRAFLQYALGSAAVAGAGTAGSLRAATGRRLQMAQAGAPAAGRSANDYRALVCVFLFGGADSVNLIVPTSTSAHATYRRTRGELAEARASLLPVSPRTSDGNTYGFHKDIPELQQRFEAGQLAVVANLGPLATPTTKDQFLARSVSLPPFLFSHNDQQAQWQAAHADGLGRTGWCGRLADRLDARNAGATTALPMNVSMIGAAPLLVGDSVSPFSLGVEGTQPLWAIEDDDYPGRRAAFQRMFAARNHMLEREFVAVQQEAIAIDAELRGGLAAAPNFDGLFPEENELAAQLRTVARTISLRGQLGLSRQVFFVGVGDYDTHDGQLQSLPLLFRQLSQALDGFQRAMEQLGEANNVTTFTSSEFGRTLSSNGRGSDHGWGGHALVMGGAVRGRDIYGRMPDLSLGGPDDIGEGRLLPEIAVDQYAATLGSWMGLSDTELDAVFPNLSRFATRNLGFMS